MLGVLDIDIEGVMLGVTDGIVEQSTTPAACITPAVLTNTAQ
jgi:hypothetical protein